MGLQLGTPIDLMGNLIGGNLIGDTHQTGFNWGHPLNRKFEIGGKLETQFKNTCFFNALYE
jgi:hypothetical protein